MQIFTNLLVSLWTDQYWHIQNLVNINFCKSLDIMLNRPTLARSKSCQRESFQISTHFKVSSMQISWHHIERTNIGAFKVSSMQISWYHIEQINVAKFKSCQHKSLDIKVTLEANLPTLLWMIYFLLMQRQNK